MYSLKCNGLVYSKTYNEVKINFYTPVFKVYLKLNKYRKQKRGACALDDLIYAMKMGTDD